MLGICAFHFCSPWPPVDQTYRSFEELGQQVVDTVVVGGHTRAVGQRDAHASAFHDGAALEQLTPQASLLGARYATGGFIDNGQATISPGALVVDEQFTDGLAEH